jgi:hypothetical protein
MSEQLLYTYDPAAALDGPQDIAIFMADALETGDAAYIAKALGVVARGLGERRRGRDDGGAQRVQRRRLANGQDARVGRHAADAHDCHVIPGHGQRDGRQPDAAARRRASTRRS